MTDYQIQASSRRCAVTGRELAPGERYFSVLLDQGDSFVRRDFCLEAWQGRLKRPSASGKVACRSAVFPNGHPSTTNCCSTASRGWRANPSRASRRSATCWLCCWCGGSGCGVDRRSGGRGRQRAGFGHETSDREVEWQPTTVLHDVRVRRAVSTS